MSRIGKWIAGCVVGSAAISGLAYGAHEWSYRDRHAYVFPLPNQSFMLRSDARGQGHFGAPRSGRRRHNGVDLAAPEGAPVVAVRGGWVIKAVHERGSGNVVILRHPHGYRSIYAHLDTMAVKPGQRLRQGDLVGTVGKTGNAGYRAIQPHLHFEWRSDGQIHDPTPWLSSIGSPATVALLQGRAKQAQQ